MGTNNTSFSLFLFFLFLVLFDVVNSEVDKGWEEWLEHMRESSDSPSSSLGWDPQLVLPLELLTGSTNTTTTVTGSVVATGTGRTGRLVTWRKVTVSMDGHGDYSTIQDAVDSVPLANNTDPVQIRTVIVIKPGIYREKVNIGKRKEHITLLGEKGNASVIVWNDTASTIGPDGCPLRTFHSATVGINAHYFAAKNIIFQNDAPPPLPGEMGSQAVALRISGDKGAFFNCTFLGHQDTLYDHKGRHYFHKCSIQGTVDFIFGSGRSLYRRCNIRTITVGERMVGSVTAQKRNETFYLDSGFSFVGCNLSGDGSVYLGRAWGANSRVVFSYTWMDNIVAPGGWNDWGVFMRQSGVYYGQFKCWGPGANTRTRVPWARRLTFEEAKPFLGLWFINGKSWL